MNEYKIFETLFDMIPFGIYVTNMETYDIVYLNSIFRKRFGDPEGKKCYELIFGNDAPCIFCKIPELLELINVDSTKSIIIEQFNDKDDSYYRMEERAIYWPNGTIVKYTIAVDTTSQKEIQNSLAEAHARLVLQSKELENKNEELRVMYEKTKDIAEKDFLTDLYNRRLFYEIGQSMVNMIVRRHLNAYIAVIDVDHFKQINDTYGHKSGDRALQEISKLLKNSFRKSDLVGRIGGEEFALILTDISKEKAGDLLENLRRLIEQHHITSDDGHIISCTVSIGAAQITKESLDASLSLADNLMYSAKKQGRNRVVMEQ